jgi:hypothetical protein
MGTELVPGIKAWLAQSIKQVRFNNVNHRGKETEDNPKRQGTEQLKELKNGGLNLEAVQGWLLASCGLTLASFEGIYGFC